jgi:hypothetical protein
MLGVVHKGVAFLILWTRLAQRGNRSSGESSDERIELIERFERLFPVRRAQNPRIQP